MITCKEHFIWHLRFSIVMRDTLRRGRNILNPQPALNVQSIQTVFFFIAAHFKLLAFM